MFLLSFRYNLLDDLKVGDTVTITVERNNQKDTQDVSVTLGSRVTSFES